MRMAHDPLFIGTGSQYVRNIAGVNGFVKAESNAIATLKPSGFMRTNQCTSINSTFTAEKDIVFAHLVSG